MDLACIRNIRLMLAAGPIHSKVHRTPHPPFWRSNQRLPNEPRSVGKQIKMRRLEFHIFQAEVAKAFGVSPVCVSRWERGVSEPSRRFRKRIRDFLGH
jgi:DNA-binding transcriptional regulator YiaG